MSEYTDHIDKVEEKTDYGSMLRLALLDVKNAMREGRTGKSEIMQMESWLTPEIKKHLGDKMLKIEKNKQERLRALRQQYTRRMGYEVIFYQRYPYRLREFEIRQQEVLEMVSAIIEVLNKMGMLQNPRTHVPASLMR